MRLASEIIFTRITGADFFNVNKGPDAHPATATKKPGGGQSYIDVNTSGVPVSSWDRFLVGASPVHKEGGPAWTIPLRSLGVVSHEELTIAQRRSTSVALREQKLPELSRKGKRVQAWHPNVTGFPHPAVTVRSATDPEIQRLVQGLVIYLIRDTEGVFWAGWFQRKGPDAEWFVPGPLASMFNRTEGYVTLADKVAFDEHNWEWPFRMDAPAGAEGDSAIGAQVGEEPVVRAEPGRAQSASSSVGVRPGTTESSEEELIQELFEGDFAPGVPGVREATRKVRSRNARAARALKDLYGECQISGRDYLFDKRDGKPYLEAHHLVPLGVGGADAPHNLIVVSAHVHRMLHHAKTSGINLADIRDNQLNITINDHPYTIHWRSEHAREVERENPPAA